MRMQKAGCTSMLVLTGSGKKDLERFGNREFFGAWAEAYPDLIAADFNEAVGKVLEQTVIR